MVKNGQILFIWDRFSKFMIKISNLIQNLVVCLFCREIREIKFRIIGIYSLFWNYGNENPTLQKDIFRGYNINSFEFFYENITLNYFKNIRFLNSFIRTIDWCEIYDAVSKKFTLMKNISNFFSTLNPINCLFLK